MRGIIQYIYSRRFLPTLIIILFSSFISWGNTNKAHPKKQICKQIVWHYYVEKQSDSLVKPILARVDTFYYNENKISYREAELTIWEEDPNRITSYMLYLTTLKHNGKIDKVKSYHIPLKPDGSIVDTAHLKSGTGQAMQEWLYSYSGDGLRKEIKYYAQNDGKNLRAMWRNTLQYNKKNYLIEEACYYNNKSKDIRKTTYKYDNKGNILNKKLYSVFGDTIQLDNEEVYTYNKQGDMETEQLINKSGEVYSKSRYEYEYNNDGRYIKKLEYRNDKLYKINERQFEYYGFDESGMGVDSNYLIKNEVWWRVIPVFHIKGPNGYYALYLYDNGHFIEKNIRKLSGEKYTREGVYYYNPDDGKVYLTYTDKMHKRKKYEYLPEKQTIVRPSYVEKSDSSGVRWKSMFSVRALNGREEAGYMQPAEAL